MKSQPSALKSLCCTLPSPLKCWKQWERYKRRLDRKIDPTFSCRSLMSWKTSLGCSLSNFFPLAAKQICWSAPGTRLCTMEWKFSLVSYCLLQGNFHTNLCACDYFWKNGCQLARLRKSIFIKYSVYMAMYNPSAIQIFVQKTSVKETVQS